MEKFVYKTVRSNRKTMSISIREGKITLCVPRSLSESVIREFVMSKQKWIEKNISRHRDFIKVAENMRIGNNALLFGQLVHIEAGNMQKRERENYLYREFYKSNSDYLLNRIGELSEQFGLKFNGLKLIYAKTLWGVCDTENNIRLNFGLLALPKELSDYVILHELVHTKFHNHSRDFWNLFKFYMPDCLSRRRLLKEYSWVLYLIKKK